MIHIQSNVPMPSGEARGRKAKYPFKDMKVGDSFFVPKSGSQFQVQSISTSGSRAVGPGRVTVRSVTEDGIEGYRVWRFK